VAFLDTYRTFCIAPNPEIRGIFEKRRAFDGPEDYEFRSELTPPPVQVFYWGKVWWLLLFQLVFGAFSNYWYQFGSKDVLVDWNSVIRHVPLSEKIFARVGSLNAIK
jgi:hypothetical protein